MHLVVELFRRHAAAAAFVWGFLKSILPIPSPSLMALAGAAVDAPTPLRAFWPIALRIALPGGAGITLGGLLYYELSRRRGEEFLKKFGQGAAKQWETVQRVRRRLGGHRGMLIGALRALPVVPVMAGAVAAGILDASPAEYLGWSLAGGFARTLVLGYAGFLLKRAEGAGSGSRWGASIGVAIAAALLGGAFWLALKLRDRAAAARAASSATDTTAA